MRRPLPDSERGGATVEFALLTMLLVPMVLYAIYSGEALAGGIKAMEAEMSAGWEVTAFRLHDYGDGGGSLQTVAQSAQQRITDDLNDFDSFSATGNSGYYGVFGHLTLDDVSCKPRSDPNGFGPSGNKYLKTDGWVQCQSAVHFENLKAVHNAHAEFYQNRPKIIQDSFNKLVMGGLGPTFKGCDGGDNSTCSGSDRGFLVLTNDYGLEDIHKGSDEVTVGQSGPNTKFYKVAESLWGGGPSAAAVMATTLELGDEGDTSTFHMGYGKTIKSTRSAGDDAGTDAMHLSPNHEASSRATKNTASLSINAYGKRTTTYLAVTQDWNKQ